MVLAIGLASYIQDVSKTICCLQQFKVKHDEAPNNVKTLLTPHADYQKAIYDHCNVSHRDNVEKCIHEENKHKLHIEGSTSSFTLVLDLRLRHAYHC